MVPMFELSFHNSALDHEMMSTHDPPHTTIFVSAQEQEADSWKSRSFNLCIYIKMFTPLRIVMRTLRV